MVDEQHETLSKARGFKFSERGYNIDKVDKRLVGLLVRRDLAVQY